MHVFVLQSEVCFRVHRVGCYLFGTLECEPVKVMITTIILSQIAHCFIKELVNTAFIVSCILCSSIELCHSIRNKNIWCYQRYIVFCSSIKAFGSWLKGIFGKAKDLIMKFAPVVKPVLGVVAPVQGKFGGVLGGASGSLVSKMGSGAAAADAFTDRVISLGGSAISGAHGGGIRWLTPRLRP